MNSIHSSPPSSVSMESGNQSAAGFSIKVRGLPIKAEAADIYENIRRIYKTAIAVIPFPTMPDAKFQMIRIDFESAAEKKKLFDMNYILIFGKKYSFEEYSPMICSFCKKEGHLSSRCNDRFVSHLQLKQMLEQHESRILSMMEDFEKRWQNRLSSISQSQTQSVDKTALRETTRQFTEICQQISQRHAQNQNTLLHFAKRLETLQV